MISITDQAIEKLQVLLKSEAGMTPRSLRVLVKTTGCSGLAYNLEYAYMQIVKITYSSSMAFVYL